MQAVSRTVNYERFCAVSTQDELMTRAEFIAAARIALPTAERWAAQGIGPKPIRLGPRLLRYRRVEVEAWLRGQAVVGTSK